MTTSHRFRHLPRNRLRIRTRLPLATLAALAVIGFVLVAMETMPAGLLPVIATGMGTSEGTVGLFVSAYALGHGDHHDPRHHPDPGHAPQAAAPWRDPRPHPGQQHHRPLRAT